MNDVPGIGHNNPPLFDTLDAEARELLAGARTLAVIKEIDAGVAEKLGKTKGDLAAIRTKLNAGFEEEKKPWLDGSRAVDEKWREVRNSVATAIDHIGKMLSGYLAEQNRIRKEAEAKAKREADEKLRIAQAAEAKAKETNDLGTILETEKAYAAADNATAEAKALKGSAKVSAGDGKRAISTRKFYSARIVNKKAALNFFSNDARIIAALQTCADEACRKDPTDPPVGVVTVVEERAV